MHGLTAWHGWWIKNDVFDSSFLSVSPPFFCRKTPSSSWRKSSAITQSAHWNPSPPSYSHKDKSFIGLDPSNTLLEMHAGFGEKFSVDRLDTIPIRLECEDISLLLRSDFWPNGIQSKPIIPFKLDPGLLPKHPSRNKSYDNVAEVFKYGSEQNLERFRHPFSCSLTFHSFYYLQWITVQTWSL